MDASMNTMQQDMTRMDVRVRRDEMREFPSALCILRLLVMEYQPLLLRRFDSTGDIVSHPLERFLTSKPQHPFCQRGYKQSCTTISATCQELSRRDVVQCVLSWRKQRLLFSFRPISAFLRIATGQ